MSPTEAILLLIIVAAAIGAVIGVSIGWTLQAAERWRLRRQVDQLNAKIKEATEQVQRTIDNLERLYE